MDNKVIKDLQDYRYLKWTKIRKSSGTAGSFLKAFDDLGDTKIYYKLSNYNEIEGVIGNECVNEVIVDRLLTILGIPHLEYQLIHALININGKELETYLCASNDFKKPGDTKVTLETYYELNRKPDETVLDFCINMGWGQYAYEMLVADYLILNRDRHGANVEILRNSKSKSVKPAPLFDHGLSLLFSATNEESIRKFDVLEDTRIQCCIGGSSAFSNLKLIPKGRKPVLNPLSLGDKKILMYNLDGVISEILKNKIWEMIWKRWQIYESL